MANERKQQKVYLKSYLRGNLGDDLFVKIITERYPNTNFYGFGLKQDKKSYGSNLKIKYGYRYVIINKCLELLTRKKKSIDRKYMKKCDKTVVLGGSMFIQNKNKNYPNYEKELKNKEYYILGVNFGEYKTKEYMESVRKFIAGAKDTCFRDKKSYEMFKELNNTRCNPDIVFSLDTNNIEIKNEKKVLISVIDCNKKFSKQRTKIYEEKIREIIKYFINKKYKIILMSFCKFQGDEKAIKRIIKKCSREEREYIQKYNYRGKINEALKVIASCEIVVGTRLHANILGLKLNKTIIPIAYSEKLINVLKDLEYKGKIFDINNIEEFKVEELKETELKYKVNITTQKENAIKHFERLDKILR